MKKFLLVIIGTLFAVHGTSAMADDFSFTGNLSDDDDVQLFEFSVGVTSTVTMRTYSYAGGVMADVQISPQADSIQFLPCLTEVKT